LAHPWHHSVRSANTWGGKPDDYLAIHHWFDESKEHLADFRHRALRHHAQGIFECERVFGPTIQVEGGKKIPTRWVGEQHVRDDLGFIPSLGDWFMQITPQRWMNRSRKLSLELDDNV
jgi:hypothetical protein